MPAFADGETPAPSTSITASPAQTYSSATPTAPPPPSPAPAPTPGNTSSTTSSPTPSAAPPTKTVDPELVAKVRKAKELVTQVNDLTTQMSAAGTNMLKADENKKRLEAELKNIEESLKKGEVAAEEAQNDLNNQARRAYEGSGGLGDSAAIFSGSLKPNDVVSKAQWIQYAAEQRNQDVKASRETIVQLMKDKAKKQVLTEEATKNHEKSVQAYKDLAERRDRLVASQRELTAALSGLSPAERADIELGVFGGLGGAINMDVAPTWKQYLADVQAAGITLPSKSVLADPSKWDSAWSPVKTKSGGVQKGVAQLTKDGKTVLILPSETVTAVSRAFTYMGTPYAWGGGSTSGPTMGFGIDAGVVGFDCSGLVMGMYNSRGYSLPRVAIDQRNATYRVPLEDALPGDLVFFGPDVHHVGIYLGNGIMLNAPHSGSVVQVERIWGDILDAGRVL